MLLDHDLLVIRSNAVNILSTENETRLKMWDSDLDFVISLSSHFTFYLDSTNLGIGTLLCSSFVTSVTC